MKGKIYRLILGICASLVMFGTIANATEIESADDNKSNNTVRVGYYQQDGYFEKQENGELYGFGAEYLKTVATYTNWEYEFLEGTREECVEWLESGVIDLLSPVYTDSAYENIILAKRIIGEDNCYI